MSNWYIGQEIVCIASHSDRLVIKGRQYSISGLRGGICRCEPVLIDVGVSLNHSVYEDVLECAVCHLSVPMPGSIFWFGESLFAPLGDISELEELLNKKPEPKTVEEKC